MTHSHKLIYCIKQAASPPVTIQSFDSPLHEGILAARDEHLAEFAKLFKLAVSEITDLLERVLDTEQSGVGKWANMERQLLCGEDIF